MTENSAATVPLPSKNRSAVTNGRRMFVDGNGNSAWSRRFRDLINVHLDDIGGREHASEAQFSLVKRIAALECELERMEGEMSKGTTVDLDVYTRASGHLRRMLETLGTRRTKGKRLDLDGYLKGRGA